MTGFDKQAVLEAILKERPVLTNLRGTDPGYLRAGGKPAVIYAYYTILGERDDLLSYDIRNPADSKPNSTLCEIYSGWVGSEQKLMREVMDGLLAKKLFYRGPRISSPRGSTNPAWDIRHGAVCDFSDFSLAFAMHFNNVCSRLNCGLRLNGGEVEIRKTAKLELGGKFIEGEAVISENIGINLKFQDPALSEVLGLIESAYKRIIAKEAPDKLMFVRKKS